MIALLPSADQSSVVDSVLDVLRSVCPVERLRNRSAEPAAAEDREWSRFANLGWFGFALAEEHGGAGFSVAEEVLVHREFGRFLVSPSLLATTLGAQAAMAAGRPDLVDVFVGGRARAAPAIPVGTGEVGARVAGRWQMLDGDHAQYLVLRGEAGVALVDRARVGATRDVAALDGSVRLTRVELAAEAAVFVPASMTPLGARFDLLLAAQLAGGAEASVKLASDYARLREQFGKPIGSFQAVAHACADMAMRAETSWALVKFAALALADGRPDAGYQIASAFLLAGEAAFENATRAIRVHGGIGFTADCDVHHYLKRAVLLRQLGGGPRAHQRRLLADAPAF